MSVFALAGVCVSFPRGQRHLVRVLADVSLEVDRGEVVSVLAQRAQGKTTLLRVAAGIVKPDRGRVYLDGEDLWELADRRRSRLLSSHVGMVAHSAPDIEVPVLESIALPLLVSRTSKREAYERARRALERVGAGECAEQFWGSLADWERALVAIARGIAREPALLLVDDLTVSFGLEETERITKLLATLAKELDLGVLMCVSDAEAMLWSERMARLVDGELLEDPVPPPERPGNIIDFPGDGAAGDGPSYGMSS
jgi:predicted ABC-type transport system involved in lysophospholipase L1 biosynthesis ATPase subunit